MIADFGPLLESYKYTGSFRFWCQKVLPLVYDDSLSYYELLCRVVNYLNDVIQNVDGLHTDVERLLEAYQELEDYVNNYFTELNVQEQINNKLDDMAEDGTLDEIINEHIFGELNEELEYLKIYVTPEMYGAAGDGVTDDTTAIQAAIDSGKVVMFVADTYLISSSLNLESGTILRSLRGSQIKRIQSTDAETQYNMLNIDTISNVKIDELHIVGNEFHHTTAGNVINDGRTGVFIKDSSNVKITNCKFSKIGSNGIYATTSSEINVLRCEFSKTTAQARDSYCKSIGVVKCDKTNFQENYFHDIDDGIAGPGTFDNASSRVSHIWSNNIFENIKEHGIYCSHSLVSIVGNTFRNVYSGIKIRSAYTTVTGNSIRAIQSAITVSAPSRHCIVDGNTVEMIDWDSNVLNIALQIDGHSLSDVLDSYEGCESTDRMIGNTISNNTITFVGDNLIGNGTNFGIRVFGSLDYASSSVGAAIQDASILGNKIIGAETGIVMTNFSERTQILNNTLIGNSPADEVYENVGYGHGISFTNGNQFWTKISGNIISQWLDGIFRNDGTTVYNFITNNIIINNNRYGINITSGHTSSGMAIIENVFLGNSTADSNVTNKEIIYNNSMYDLHKNYRFGDMYRSAIPDQGTFAKGDIVWNSNPSAGGTLLWVCIVAGTPGTWAAVPVGS